MRDNLIIVMILTLIMFGCNTKSKENDSKEKILLEKEIELLKKEKELLQSNDTDIKIDEILVDQKENNTKQVKIDRNYLLLDKSVGKFKIGNSIPFPGTSDDYKINKETQTRMTEEGPEEETVYIVTYSENEIMQLKPEYDYNIGQYTQNIGEIILTTPFVKTLEGIGVGSSIEDFIEQYPNYNIWYTYISDMYVIESKDINAQFILNYKDFASKINVTSEKIELKKTDFKPKAKILKIRVL